MSQSSQTVNNAKPITLSTDATKRSRGLWAEAFIRLRRNRMAMLGLIVIFLMVFAAIFADQIAPYHYADQQRVNNNVVPPWIRTFFPNILLKGEEGGYARVSTEYPLGADALGRDLLSRLIYGARISLSVAFLGPLVSLIIGVVIGCLAGFYGGWIDNVLMRIVDILYAFPSLLLIILMMAFFRGSADSAREGTFAFTINQIDRSFGGLFFIFIAIGITSWENMARITRGQVLSVRQREFVMAAESVGMSRGKILRRHVLPNIVGPLIVAETLAIPSYILTEAFLSYIGIGVQAPMPSWGAMISDGAAGIRSYTNQAVFPALALAITMIAFNFLGDGLRDALDPRMRGVD
jgi:oligopeptide transport system permease protein